MAVVHAGQCGLRQTPVTVCGGMLRGRILLCGVGVCVFHCVCCGVGVLLCGVGALY